MVDIHCHILPGVDDGAKSWDMSEEMCRVAIADGIKHIVCSPHANDDYKYDRIALEESMAKLRELASSLEFSLGCDFHFSFENVQAFLANPDNFVISNTDYLLVEFSDFSLPPSTLDALKHLSAIGITPIITHPERNLMLQRKPEQVLALAKSGCVIQVTANSLTGHWGNGPKRMAKWLLDQDAVHVVASDAHDPSFRPPILSKARKVIEEAYGEDIGRALLEENPRAIVSNQRLPFFPEID